MFSGCSYSFAPYEFRFTKSFAQSMTIALMISAADCEMFCFRARAHGRSLDGELKVTNTSRTFKIVVFGLRLMINSVV
jgi:hypothetical protein